LYGEHAGVRYSGGRFKVAESHGGYDTLGAAMNIVWKDPLYDFVVSRGTQAAHLYTLRG
jgi:hypothetical protein